MRLNGIWDLDGSIPGDVELRQMKERENEVLFKSYWIVRSFGHKKKTAEFRSVLGKSHGKPMTNHWI